LAMVVTRTTCRDETPIALSLALNIGFVLAGGAGLLFVAQTGGFSAQTFLTAPWIAMAAQEWLTMAVLATSVLIGSVGAAFAYQNAPPAIVGTFDFAYVGFAVIWGLVFFAERPDAISWVGIGMIVVSGMLSVRR
ncbi:MAG: EamA/RhaT family transporter, partial [Albidovulum sp.]